MGYQGDKVHLNIQVFCVTFVAMNPDYILPVFCRALSACLVLLGQEGIQDHRYVHADTY